MNREQAEQMNPGDPVTVTLPSGHKEPMKWSHYDGELACVGGGNGVIIYANPEWVERARMAEPRRVGETVEASTEVSNDRLLFTLCPDGFWRFRDIPVRWSLLVDPVEVPADDPRLLLPVRGENE